MKEKKGKERKRKEKKGKERKEKKGKGRKGIHEKNKKNIHKRNNNRKNSERREKEMGITSNKTALPARATRPNAMLHQRINPIKLPFPNPEAVTALHCSPQHKQSH